MRITMREISVETGDTAEAVALINAFRNGTSPEPKRKPKLVAAHRPKALTAATRAEPDMTMTLGPQLTETWQWLVANDSRAGSTSDQVGDGLGISRHAAVWRLGELIKKGIAHRVKPGRYRAGER